MAARYGHAHQKARKVWQRRLDAGEVILCRRTACGTCLADDPRIYPDEDWHLGHPDVECDAPTAPEHAGTCNLPTSTRFVGRAKPPARKHPGLR